MKKIHLILIALLLFILGSYFYEDLLPFIIPKDENVSLVSKSLASQFTEPFYFGVSLALIPILIMMSWNFVSNKNLSALLILGFSAVGFFINYYQLRFVTSFKINDAMQVIDLESVNYSIFIFCGSLIGFFLSIIIFRKSTPQSS